MSATVWPEPGAFEQALAVSVLLAARLLPLALLVPWLAVPRAPLALSLAVTAVLVLRSLITELARRGKAILYSSHIMESVERVCSRVMVLHRGAVVADDSSANLRTLMSRDSLEAVFAELVVQDNPDRTAADIADVSAMRA